MHLVIHSPFGARINRAYGLALRKRFCRTFNFELQAAATEDAIVLSLGEAHSFVLDEVARFLHSNSVEQLLIQAVLDAPLFTTRWRWNATISLAVKRSRAGKKTPAPLQRMAAEDLLSVLFPDQLACAENLRGEREIPDHLLVRQTLYDCLHEAMDIDGLIALLERMQRGEVQVLARDLPSPSPLSQEVFDRAALRVPGRCAAGRAAHECGGFPRRWLDPADSVAFRTGLDSAAIAMPRSRRGRCI